MTMFDPANDVEELRREVAALRCENRALRLQVAASQEAAATGEIEMPYHALFEAVDDGLAIIEFADGPEGPSSDYRHIYCNPAFDRHSGLASTLGKTVREIVPDEAGTWIERFRSVLETGKPARFRQTLEATGLHLEVSAFRMEPACLRRIAVLFEDVTQSVVVEDQLADLRAELAALVECSSEVQYRINGDWSELAELTGGSFIADTSSGNRNWLEDYIPESDRNAVRAEIARAIAAKETYEIEHRVFQVDGSIGWALSRAAPFFDGEGRIERWIGVASDITARKEVEEQQQALNQELAHRMKNTLAMVQAIVLQTLRQSRSHEAAMEAITSRLTAMGRAQDILTRSSWKEADIRDVVEAAVSPHATGTERIERSGPAVSLTSQQALGLSLAIHELATNAAKYGALSNKSGRVSMIWDADRDGFTFRWIESEGPAVVEPESRGFGSRLIERIVASYFDGDARIAFEPAGIKFTLDGRIGLAANC